MKVVAKRSFFGGFDSDEKRINYEKGKTYDVSEKVVNQFPNDFQIVAAKANAENAQGVGAKK